MIPPKWSLFSRWFGVRLRLHPLFSILLVISVLTGHFLEMITLFGIVLIHELGHAAMAKQFGWRMREVQLTPFGGVATTDEDGSIPAREEAFVALAGPAMNALMIGFAFLLWWTGLWTHVWTMYFVKANLTLLLFNLLPILPLDGGKLVRVVVGYMVPYYQTLKTTTCWSLLASAALAGYAAANLKDGGFALNLALIGTFLLYSNWYEWKTAPYRFFRFLLGRGERVKEWLRRGVKPSPIVVDSHAPLSAVVKRLLRERLHWIIVTAPKDRVLGVLTEEECIKHYLEKEQNRAVSDLFM